MAIMQRFVITSAALTGIWFMANSRAEETATKPSSEPSGFTFHTGDKSSSINVGLFGQGRFSYTEDSVKSLSFSVPRARVIVKGQVGSERATYYSAVGMEGQFELVDLWFNYGWEPEFQTQFGRFKIPFSRFYLVDSQRLAFTSHHNQINNFSLQRDVGANVHGLLAEDHVDFNIFVFNGNRNLSGDSNMELITGVRVNLNLIDKVGFEEMDWFGTGPRLSMGMAAVYDSGDGTAVSTDDKLVRGTLDSAFMCHGWTLALAGNILRNIDTKDNNYGFDSLISYFVVPQKFVVALKGSGTVRMDAGALLDGSVDTYEAAGALTYFLHEQNVRITGEYGAEFGRRGYESTDHRLRAQLQVWL